MLSPLIFFLFLSVALQTKPQRLPLQVSVEGFDSVAARLPSRSLYFNLPSLSEVGENEEIEITSQVYLKANLILSLISNPRALKGGVGCWG